jgi:UTP--glucose-1-phosphate uridylyltransferase
MGTRFLPATKSQPKEMLPVVDRPVIQYVVEEAVAAGADDILIITGRSKRALEDHFDYNPDLKFASDSEEIRRIDELTTKAPIHFIRQRRPIGLADAIGLARHHVGSEPFGVLLGDTINICKTPLLKQLWTHFQRIGYSVIAVEDVPVERVANYGIVQGRSEPDGLILCEEFFEKPSPAVTPSRLGVTGAYVFTSRLFDAIDSTKPGVNGEVQLSDALQHLSRFEPVYGARFEGTRYDIGDRFLWLKANLELALQQGEYQGRLATLMARLLKGSEFV